MARPGLFNDLGLRFEVHLIAVALFATLGGCLIGTEPGSRGADAEPLEILLVPEPSESLLEEGMGLTLEVVLQRNAAPVSYGISSSPPLEIVSGTSHANESLDGLSPFEERTLQLEVVLKAHAPGTYDIRGWTTHALTAASLNYVQRLSVVVEEDGQTIEPGPPTRDHFSASSRLINESELQVNIASSLEVPAIVELRPQRVDFDGDLRRDVGLRPSSVVRTSFGIDFVPAGTHQIDVFVRPHISETDQVLLHTLFLTNDGQKISRTSINDARFG